MGLSEYTAGEQTFATALQKAAGLEATGVAKQIEPIPNEPYRCEFTGVGDVNLVGGSP